MIYSIAFLIDSVPFTPQVVAGETSLGGSESACLGLARALAARGHDVHVFATEVSPEVPATDAWGVKWHHLNDFRAMNEFIEWDVVCALRMFAAFWYKIHARLRLLWCQDLLVPGQMHQGVMAVSWALDKLLYVSQYHRDQWEDLEPILKPLGWVTRNGIDLAQIPEHATRDQFRIIHCSRPERGLGPLLTLWPQLKQRVPEATLQICRYSSMYDQGPGSWSDTCAMYDQRVMQVNAEVGGITYLGELTKPQLYQAISEAAVMWYPGVSSFAETSCIAATEANACGTPFVGSYRGALVETARPSDEAGLLIKGEVSDGHIDEAYADASVSAVQRLLQDCRGQSFRYRALSKAGKAHASSYGYAQIAAEWEAQIDQWFTERYEAHKVQVLRALLHEDDHVAARLVAEEAIGDDGLSMDAIFEAKAATEFCDHVMAGKDQTADDYAEHAIADPVQEAEHSERFHTITPMFKDCTYVLDVACGNGSFAIALALANTDICVHGVDYAAKNIDRARDGAVRAGVADRCTFDTLTVYDFNVQQLHGECQAWVEQHAAEFDGLFVGEFIEHCANHRAVIDGLEPALADGAHVVYTCPHGPCSELVPRWMPLRRGHVHHFHADDLRSVFGSKQDFGVTYLAAGITERGAPLGNWLVEYTKQTERPAGGRPFWERIKKTRPMARLTVGLIVKDAETELAKCLTSVYNVADEILIGDTGSTDKTKSIAAEFKATVLDLPSVMDHPQGFAGVRNQVLAQATGDWFLWIDADETLLHPHLLRQYLDAQTFHGYVLHQTHLYLDAHPTYDSPCRLFRRLPSIQFYGCIHEQPQMDHCNGEIVPCLELNDPLIVHTGYLTEEGREEKRVERNKPLLIRDQHQFADRLLGKVLLLREAVIEADVSLANTRGQMTARAAQGYRHAIALYVRYFDDPAHKFESLVRPWYEAALRHLGVGFEVELALAGRVGGLKQARAKPQRLWVRDAEEYERLLTYQIKDGAKKMLPVTFKTLPFVESETTAQAV